MDDRLRQRVIAASPALRVVAIATQFHGSRLHLAMGAAVLSELAAFLDLALAGRVRAFFGHRDLLGRLYACRIFTGKPSSIPTSARRVALTLWPRFRN